MLAQPRSQRRWARCHFCGRWVTKWNDGLDYSDDGRIVHSCNSCNERRHPERGWWHHFSWRLWKFVCVGEW